MMRQDLYPFPESVCLLAFIQVVLSIFTWISVTFLDHLKDTVEQQKIFISIFTCGGYVLTAALSVGVLLYLRGYFFTFTLPEDDSRESQLRCVKSNIRAWVEYNHWVFRGSKEAAYQRLAQVHQESFAWHLAIPDDNRVAAYHVSMNPILVLLNFTSAYLVCKLSLCLDATYLRWTGDDTLGFWRIFLVSLIVIWFSLIIYDQGLLSGDLGRARRMGYLAREIRRECFHGNIEIAETPREKLIWWIGNLVQSTGSKDIIELNDTIELDEVRENKLIWLIDRMGKANNTRSCDWS